MSLKEEAYGDGAPYPLDVLDAKSAGQIGYVVELELELDNVVQQPAVAVLTRVRVDAARPAARRP
ncbi:MAG: carbamate kinase [Solirubrobacterales bacterium]|nr:carbamate kinase [Solirubrobacterales bacterium]